MNLKGREIKQVLHDGLRLRVWYEEDGERKCYSGRVTHYNPNPQLGLRVWFDGFSASEQEWVNESDEWEWEDAPSPVSPDPPADPDSAPAEGFSAVHLKLRENGKQLTQRLAPKTGRGDADAESEAAKRSSLSLSLAESSPRKFNKKARLLKAGGGPATTAFGAPEAEFEPPSSSAASAATASGGRDLDASARSSEARPSRSIRAGALKKEVKTEVKTEVKMVKTEAAAESTPSSAEPRCSAAKAAAAAGSSQAPAGASQRAASTPAAVFAIKICDGPGGVRVHVPQEGAAAAAAQRRMAPPPPAERELCKLSLKPAIYRDPESGEPFGSLEAFRKLRGAREGATAAGTAST